MMVSPYLLVDAPLQDADEPEEQQEEEEEERATGQVKKEAGLLD